MVTVTRESADGENRRWLAARARIHAQEATLTPTTTSQTVTVGRFTMSGNTVTGPADYMASEAYARRIAAIEGGRDVVFNFGAGRIGQAGFATSLEAAILVSIQTDYAAWRGLQTLGVGGRS